MLMTMAVMVLLMLLFMMSGIMVIVITMVMAFVVGLQNTRTGIRTLELTRIQLLRILSQWTSCRDSGR